MYTRITIDSFNHSKMIDSTDDVYKYVHKDKPAYISPFFYTKEQFEQFKETNSIAGIKEVTTNKLWWDFDCKNDIGLAQESTKQLIKRLMEQGFKESDLQVKFSGGKGFHVLIDTDVTFNRNEVVSICTKLAEDLIGFDDKVYLPTQIFRLPLSKHNKTGLYARPLMVSDIFSMDKTSIIESAKDVSDISPSALKSHYTTGKVNDTINSYKTYIQTSERKVTEISNDLKFDFSTLDFSQKPKFLDNPKFALQKGFFYGSETKPTGDRTQAMLCLASTYKNQGFDKEHTYRILKAVAELQSKRTGEERFSNDQLWTEIIASVYSPSWRGGQFSLNDPNSWLYKYSKEYKIPTGENRENPSTIGELNGGFSTFIKNIEENTVKTGITKLDKIIPMTTGTNIAIIGSAGSGKTAIALKILENTSTNGVLTVFASLDMHRNRLYEKLIYRVTGMEREEIYRIYKEGGEEMKKIHDLIKQKYKNVWIYDRSGATINDVRDYIHKVQQLTGEKVKMVLFDYFERINSDISDDTASSKKVAGEIQDLISDLDIVAITLVQPNKFSLSGGSNTPIRSFTAIKGSSFLYQSFRGIISLWRPFYTSETKEMDHYMQMAILKNDLGELDELTFSWEGKRGEIKDLSSIEYEHFKEQLASYEKNKNGSKSNTEDF